ncbi:MAG: transposase, partial [Verrucomicrobiales bacterium]|nr:transposase [Verrucomicrobiales bacterium]
MRIDVRLANTVDWVGRLLFVTFEHGKVVPCPGALDMRVRADDPLRRLHGILDLTFVRAEVARCYGRNGNVSVDPVVLVKLMILLFHEDIASERELMARLAEGLDYLWFLGFSLDTPIPDHSVLSKARKRWGAELFQQLFVRSVRQCVDAGLVDGRKLHMDSSLVDANASKDSIVQGPVDLITALKHACGAMEAKLDEGITTPESYEAVSERTCCSTDPDATVVSKSRSEGARARYHHHRAMDDHCGVVTAVETTTGAAAENRRLMALATQAEGNTGLKPETLVADRKYGTSENYVAAQHAGYRTHMGDLRRSQVNPRKEGIFDESEFVYDAATDTFRCPAGQVMKPRRVHPVRKTKEYITAAKTCMGCALRERCTRSRTGRTVHRHEHQELLDRAREQAHGDRARADRRRRQYLLEGSFAEAANNHGFKRARWRRLWRQQIQHCLIAAVQNWRIMLREREPATKVLPNLVMVQPAGPEARELWARKSRCARTHRNGTPPYAESWR